MTTFSLRSDFFFVKKNLFLFFCVFPLCVFVFFSLLFLSTNKTTNVSCEVAEELIAGVRVPRCRGSARDV